MSEQKAVESDRRRRVRRNGGENGEENSSRCG